uniref:EGF-like domain-containing protein n=1 Tax=Anolis carolinensis TaxID=28377 RepID=A0A803U1F1_ANOCA
MCLAFCSRDSTTLPHTTPLCKEGYCVFSFNLPLTSSPDVDECRRSPRPCAGGRCENSVGSFSCRCRAGYQADPSGAECHDIDECAKTPPPCANGRCYNTPGSFSCSCPSGYQLDPVDIDECSQSPPPCARGRCHNSPGSYRCACPTGYQPGPTGTECLGESIFSSVMKVGWMSLGWETSDPVALFFPGM